MDFLVLFFILLGIFSLIAIILSLQSKAPEHTPIREKIEGTEFIPSQMFMGGDGQSGIAVNESQRRLCLLNTPSSPPRQLSCSQLVGTLVVKNGEIIEQGIRSAPQRLVTFHRELQRKLHGHIRHMHHNPSNPTNQQIDLIVIVHDTHNPFHTVNMLDMDTKEGGILFEKALGTARHWHSLLDGLLLQADRMMDSQTEHPSQETEKSDGVTEELDRLHGLVEKQVLTQDEFNLHKQQLLGTES